MPPTVTLDAPHSAGQLLPFRQSLMAMLGMCFVIMLVAVDQTVVGTALPTIVSELHGFNLYAWVATSYLLTSVITVPIFGRLGDYYGRKPFVVAAIIVFTVASVLCGAAQSMPQLVAARALQGVGGGMLVGTAFACIPDLFPDTRVRLRWQVMVASAFGIANAVGPSLGGILTEHYGWRSVFYVNLPIGLLGAWFVLRHMPHLRQHAGGRIRLDWPGALLITVALGSLQLLVELLPQDDAGGAVTLLAVGSAAAFFALYAWEKRCDHPIVPVDMLRDRNLAMLFMMALLVGTTMFTLLFYAPLLMQGGFGLSPQQAGLLVTPLAAFITVGSIAGGRVIPRLANPNHILYAGFTLLAASCMGVLASDRGTAHWLLAVYMMLGGLGMGFVMPTLTIFTQHAAGRAHLGIATALLQSLRMIGGMVGTAVVGTVVSHMYASRTAATLGGKVDAASLEQLSDPRVLVDAETQGRLLTQWAGQGVDGTAMLDTARQALVTAIHGGQVIALVVALAALWCVYRAPRVHLALPGHSQSPKSAGE
ncbi:transporter [Bordetella ansorpii]|uniref:Transporter n=1 Tax=Bordetella ansorpii TaxID=288768 RepID=A0A157ME22_9BORD|nr:MDR family MFS transporter [Bordetella ansorpii]SAI07046.1 transporter [Bordetella ansorpii]